MAWKNLVPTAFTDKPKVVVEFSMPLGEIRKAAISGHDTIIVGPIVSGVPPTETVIIPVDYYVIFRDQPLPNPGHGFRLVQVQVLSEKKLRVVIPENLDVMEQAGLRIKSRPDTLVLIANKTVFVPPEIAAEFETRGAEILSKEQLSDAFP